MMKDAEDIKICMSCGEQYVVGSYGCCRACCEMGSVVFECRKAEAEEHYRRQQEEQRQMLRMDDY